MCFLFPTCKYLEATLFSPHLTQKLDGDILNNSTKVATVPLGNVDSKMCPKKLPPLSTRSLGCTFSKTARPQQRLCKQSTYPERDENFSFSYRHPHSLSVLDSWVTTKVQKKMIIWRSPKAFSTLDPYSFLFLINEEQHSYPIMATSITFQRCTIQ